jgi:hypothetical protein
VPTCYDLPSHIQIGRIDTRRTINEGNKGDVFAAVFLVDLICFIVSETRLQIRGTHNRIVGTNETPCLGSMMKSVKLLLVEAGVEMEYGVQVDSSRSGANDVNLD